MSEFDTKYRQRLLRLSTTNIADALDALSLKGATYGIRPLWESAGKIVGRAVTLKITAAGLTKGKTIWASRRSRQASAATSLSSIMAGAWTPLAGAEFSPTAPR